MPGTEARSRASRLRPGMTDNARRSDAYQRRRVTRTPRPTTVGRTTTPPATTGAVTTAAAATGAAATQPFGTPTVLQTTTAAAGCVPTASRPSVDTAIAAKALRGKPIEPII